MKRNLILVFVTIIIESFAYPQADNSIFVNAIVTNNKGMFLKDVAIYDNNNTLIGITNRDGKTEFHAYSNDTVFFSHIGFERKAVKIDTLSSFAVKDGIYSMLVVLEKKPHILPKAVVVENAPHLAYSNKDIWVSNYKVTNNGLYLIVDNISEHTLILLSHEQDTLSKIKIDDDFENFYEDAFGNIHLYSTDSVYQTFYDGEKLNFIYSNDYKTFSQVLFPVKVVTDSILITQKYGLLYQEIFYYKVHRRTKEFGLLANLIGSASEAAKFFWIDVRRDAIIDRVMAENPMFVDPNNVRFGNDLSFLEQDDDVLPNASINEEEIYNNTILKHFYNSAYFTLTPIYCPIEFINDTIYVFDFENDKLMRFNEDGTFVSESDMTFHRTTYFKNIRINNPWDNNIIVDKAIGKCYAQFSTDGIVTLKEINLKDGTIHHEIKLSDHYFPTNIQIYNNFVYYLFIDSRKQMGNCRSLYKMELK